MMLPARALCSVIFLFFISVQSISQVTYTVRGKVVDFDTHQPLKNVSVVIRQTKAGTVTNDSGFFSLPVHSPEQVLVFSFVGYVHANRDLHLQEENRPLNIEMKKKADEQLDEVVVNAYKEN